MRLGWKLSLSALGLRVGLEGIPSGWFSAPLVGLGVGFAAGFLLDEAEWRRDVARRLGAILLPGEEARERMARAAALVLRPVRVYRRTYPPRGQGEPRVVTLGVFNGLRPPWLLPSPRRPEGLRVLNGGRDGAPQRPPESTP